MPELPRALPAPHAANAPCITTGWERWDAGEWLDGCSEFTVDAGMSEADIAALCAELEAEAAADCVVVTGLREFLEKKSEKADAEIDE